MIFPYTEYQDLIEYTEQTRTRWPIWVFVQMIYDKVYFYMSKHKFYALKLQIRRPDVCSED